MYEKYEKCNYKFVLVKFVLYYVPLYITFYIVQLISKISTALLENSSLNHFPSLGLD